MVLAPSSSVLGRGCFLKEVVRQEEIVFIMLRTFLLIVSLPAGQVAEALPALDMPGRYVWRRRTIMS